MRISSGEEIISLMVPDEGMVLTATENGYGKCTPIDDYPRKGRGTKGVISIQVTPRNGAVIGAMAIGSNDEIMLITDTGKLVRTRAAEINVLGRVTQGVKLISLSPGERLAGLERILEEVGEDDHASG